MTNLESTNLKFLVSYLECNKVKKGSYYSNSICVYVYMCIYLACSSETMIITLFTHLVCELSSPN